MSDRQSGSKKGIGATGLLSWMVHVAVLPKSGFPLQIHADPAQCAALAELADIIAVEDFKAELVLKRWRKDGVSLKGRLFCRLEQACIISLEPVEQKIATQIERLFVPENSPMLTQPDKDSTELLIDFDGSDAPDAFTGNAIDVFEVLAEEFFLALDPFPRKAGISLEQVYDQSSQYLPAKKGRAKQGANSQLSKSQSAFAVLKRLRTDGK